ncbi:uncharacterized protein N7459_002720 [Penicillium hispanicum]|uniref:uncharacterized protein n=1 Tax=Penicillium hispanicum TaxID=1080232 RepID=UPI00254116CF|nr:uncharacterized protein N7459_002720 [Penicillium hispanicum]KAJ5586955.1 hypothetical protein N7459_002720 [Penicillium hispanicum]
MPTAPPPPPPPADPRSKISPAVLKLKCVSPDHFFSPGPPPQTTAPPTGPYFFYGSLRDPSLLAEILGLPAAPTLRPASLDGYQCKLWGQYPALVAADSSDVVEGSVYSVTTAADAQRLAEYETRHYRAVSCEIRYADVQEPVQEAGYVFLFVGEMGELTEGRFDLEVWLRRVGRGSKR